MMSLGQVSELARHCAEGSGRDPDKRDVRRALHLIWDVYIEQCAVVRRHERYIVDLETRINRLQADQLPLFGASEFHEDTDDKK